MSDLSYSLHLGSKDNAIRDVKKLSYVNKHNVRSNEDVIILVGTNNIVTDVTNLYRNEFDDSLKEYNEKQTRNDRKINDYLLHVNESNKNIANEMIIQIGDKDDWSNYDFRENKEVIISLFENQISALKETMPDFKIANVSLHLDESTPHIHVVGIPVSNDFKKGMSKQISQSKVFTKTKMVDLQDNMRVLTSEKVKSVLGKEFKEKGKGHKYMSVDKYKQSQQLIEQQLDALKLQLKQEEEKLEKAKSQHGIRHKQFTDEMFKLEAIKKEYNDVKLQRDNMLRSIDVKANEKIADVKATLSNTINEHYDNNIQTLMLNKAKSTVDSKGVSLYDKLKRSVMRDKEQTINKVKTEKDWSKPRLTNEELTKKAELQKARLERANKKTNNKDYEY